MKLKIYPRDNSPPTIKIKNQKQLKPKIKMKKLFKTLFVANLLLTITSNAQITEENWLVGGSASFGKSSSKSEGGFTQSSTGLRIEPNIGYFVKNKFALGLSASFGYSKTDGGVSTIGYGGGPFVRYYFLKPEKIVNILAEAKYSIGTSKTQGIDESTFGTSYNFKAGPVIFFNSSVALEMTLNYDTVKSDQTIFNDLTFALGFQIHLENNN